MVLWGEEKWFPSTSRVKNKRKRKTKLPPPVQCGHSTQLSACTQSWGRERLSSKGQKLNPSWGMTSKLNKEGGEKTTDSRNWTRNFRDLGASSFLPQERDKEKTQARRGKVVESGSSIPTRYFSFDFFFLLCSKLRIINFSGYPYKTMFIKKINFKTMPKIQVMIILQQISKHLNGHRDKTSVFLWLSVRLISNKKV